MVSGLSKAVLLGIAVLGSLSRDGSTGGAGTGTVSPDRLRAISARYLGVPYKLDCLGEAAGVDSDPLFDRTRADCQTLVEQVMAEAVAPDVGGLDTAVRLIRYRGSEVRLADRYHYCVPDWLENPWPAVDVTAAIGKGLTVSTQRRIDRAALLKKRGVQAAVPVQQVRTVYVPRAQVGRLLDRIPDGSIGILVSDRKDLVAGHLGFLFRRNGKVVLRHASQTRKKVIDEPLTTYLARAPKRFVGMQLLQPDLSGLRRR